MMVSPVVDIVLRGLQALFGIVVLGISVTLIRGYHWGSLPATLGFAAFIGGFSFLMAIISVLSNWRGILQGQIAVASDGLVALLNIAGGILMAIKLAGIRCEKADSSITDAWKLVKSDICCGGFDKSRSFPFDCYYVASNDVDTLIGRCKATTADAVFMWMTFIVLAVSATLAYLRTRKGI